MIKTSLLLAALALTSLACRQPAGEQAAPPVSEPTPVESGTAAGTEAAVEYEPAYPTDVSGEGLSESDVAQQETHSHGEGEEHSHDEEEHEHGEGEAHDGHQH